MTDRLRRATLRCVYLALEAAAPFGGSILRGPGGVFSSSSIEALRACYTARVGGRLGVEVVLTSAATEMEVAASARLLGLGSSYVCEGGSLLVLDGERQPRTGGWVAGPFMNVAEKLIETGTPELLFERFAGRLDWHPTTWRRDRPSREFTLLMRGNVETPRVNALLVAHGHKDVRLLDDGVTAGEMPGLDAEVHAYLLAPRQASIIGACARHMEHRRYVPAECIAIGASREDIELARLVGRLFAVPKDNRPDKAMRDAVLRHSNATLTEREAADGVLEAIRFSLPATE